MGIEDKKEMLNNLKRGELIKYKPEPESEEIYVIVNEVKWGRIYGQMAVPIGIDSISIDELVKKEFSLGKFS